MRSGKYEHTERPDRLEVEHRRDRAAALVVNQDSVPQRRGKRNCVSS